MVESAVRTSLIMKKTDLIVRKEDLFKRFLKLTEEALQKAKAKEEARLPLILEKRQRLILEISEVEKKLTESGNDSKNQSSELLEIKAKIFTLNKELQEVLEENFLELREDIGKTKRALKINKAYQHSSGYSIFLNSKN